MKRLITCLLILLSFHEGKSQYVFQFRNPESQDFFLDIDHGPVPKWNKEGDKLAFISNTKNQSKIIVVSNDTIVIISGGQNDFKWSHDGTKIIYSAKTRSTKTKTIFLQTFYYDLTSNKSYPLSSPNRSSFYPDIFPKDTLIVYYGCSDYSAPFQLFISNIKNGIEEGLIHDSAFQYLKPKISPNGVNLLYYKADVKGNPLGGDYEIINFKRRQLIFSLESLHYDFHDWSPDGTKILAHEFDNELCSQIGRFILFDINTGSKKILSQDFGEIHDATWGKASNQIAVNADRDIFIISVDGSVSKLVEKAYSPSWHPSGKKIVFVKLEKGFPIYEINTDGTGLKLLYDGKKKKKK